MATLTNILVGLAALSGPAAAKVLRPQPVQQLSPRSGGDNLIDLRQDRFGGGGVPDEQPVIRAAESSEVLRPIRPASTAAQASSKAGDKKGFELRDAQSMFWGGDSGTTAEFSIKVDGEKEAFVDMEYFDDLVESVDCPKEGGKLTIRFKEQADFDSATEVWEWVNKEADNEFILMAGDGDCTWNDDRVIYRVKDLEYSDDENTAVLNTERTNWKEAIHSFDLKIGKDAARDQAIRRDISPGFNVPMDFDLTGKGVSFNMNGVDYIGFCSNCTATGSFDIEAHFSLGFFELDEAKVTLSTEGIETTAIIAATIKGELTDDLLEKEFPLFKASPAGVAIPGLVTIGPTVQVALKAGVNAIKGGVTLTLGGTAKIPPSSATIDFLSEDGMTSEGWEIESEAVPLEADIFVEARAFTSLTPSVGLEVSALERGFVADISADTPVLAGLVRAVHSLTCNACGQYENAVDGSVTLGTSIGVAVKKKKSGGLIEDLWSLTFFSIQQPPLASFCEPVGPQNCENNSTEAAVFRL